MDFKKFKQEAKKAMEERDGASGAKGDAADLAAITKGKVSASQRAQSTSNALKTPGGGAKAPRR